MTTAQAQSQTRCRRCLEWNDGDPWYCDRCGKETTLTPHDGGTLGDTAAWTRETPVVTPSRTDRQPRTSTTQAKGGLPPVDPGTTKHPDLVTHHEET